MLGSVNDLYTRFQIARPDYLGDDHWACIEREADRQWRSLAAGDGSQALSDIKCLVESISRIVLEIDGTPAAPNTAFDTVVTQAHTLLTGQPGHELANQSTFGQLSTQASKIARNLGNIRNEGSRGARRILQRHLIDVIHRAMTADHATWRHHITRHQPAA